MNLIDSHNQGDGSAVGPSTVATWEVQRREEQDAESLDSTG